MKEGTVLMGALRIVLMGAFIGLTAGNSNFSCQPGYIPLVEHVAQVNQVPLTRPGVLAVHRYWSKSEWNHFMTTGSQGIDTTYTDDGVSFYVFKEKQEGTAPLYSCRYDGRDTFLSRRADCEEHEKYPSEARYLVGWVYTDHQPESQPLYRCFNGDDAATADHYSIMNKAGCVASGWDSAIFPLGYVPTSSRDDFYYSIADGGYVSHPKPVQGNGKFGKFQHYGYRPTGIVGLVYPPSRTGTELKTLYSCVGTREDEADDNWGYHYYADRPDCAGHHFGTRTNGEWCNGKDDDGDGDADEGFEDADGDGVADCGELFTSTEWAKIYSSAGDVDDERLGLYQYWIDEENGGSVLSTVAPGEHSALNVMRYTSEANQQPLGWVRRSDYNLDGNERWILGKRQSLCYGITSYQTTCPETSTNLSWEIIELLTGEKIFTKTGTNQLDLTAQDIQDLLDKESVHAHRPLLLTVRGATKNLVASKTVRIIRTPFVAQYESDVNTDDGFPDRAPTKASAVLMANQMTAHTAFTDPVAARTKDPALFDGILYNFFFSAPTTRPLPTDESLPEIQRTSFEAMDNEGVLVGTEVNNDMFVRFMNDPGAWMVLPYNQDAQMTIYEAMLDKDIQELAGESFDIETGKFVRELGTRPPSNNFLSTSPSCDGFQRYPDVNNSLIGYIYRPKVKNQPNTVALYRCFDTEKKDYRTTVDPESCGDPKEGEWCNGIDDDNDNLVDEGFEDTDGDGFANCYRLQNEPGQSVMGYVPTTLNEYPTRPVYRYWGEREANSLETTLEEIPDYGYFLYDKNKKEVPFYVFQRQELGTIPLYGCRYAKEPALVDKPFNVDYSKEKVVQWLIDGMTGYLERQHENAIHLSFLNLSEGIKLQSAGLRNTHLPYHLSPTFSEAAFDSFQAWQRTEKGVGTGSEYALPVLLEHYDKAEVANNRYLHRIESAEANTEVWIWWAEWRRATFNSAIARIARAMKDYRDDLSYSRSPLQIVAYNWMDWATLDGERFDYHLTLSCSIDPAECTKDEPSFTTNVCGTHREFGESPHSEPVYWEDGLFFGNLDAPDCWKPKVKVPELGETVFVDSGEDYHQLHTADSTAFDYFVWEVKKVPDAIAEREIERFLAWQDQAADETGQTPGIGLHVDTEYPFHWGDANYMDVNLNQVFQDAETGEQSFIAPQFDMVFVWEAQCEYLMTTKSPDEPNSSQPWWQPEDLGMVGTYNPVGPFCLPEGECNYGSYQGVLSRYDEIIGDYCLLRHDQYNMHQHSLRNHGEGRSQEVMRENMRRLIAQRYEYLRAQ